MDPSRSKQLIDLDVLRARGTRVAKTAVVHDGARIGGGVEIGDWCVIGPRVAIGDGATLRQNVIVEGETSIGPGAVVHQFCVIGSFSHDLKFAESESRGVSIGRDVVVREFTNIHAGTPLGRRGTFIGDEAYIMSHCHVGHDCEIGQGAMLSQGVTLGGEVSIGDHAVIGGCSAVHQLCAIGEYSMIGGCSKITMDVMPYALSDGNPQKLDGLNILGLKRKGFSDAEIRVAKEMYKTLFLEGAMVWGERLAAAEKVYGDSPIARRIFDFIGGVSRRPLARPRKKFLGLGDA